MTASRPESCTGGTLLVRQLERLGVDTVFCVPGESFLPVLDALHDSSVRVVACRHEGGAAMMAEATGKLQGRPGIALVTRGPGASNAAAGVHVAQQDSTPMILFIGQVPTGDRYRDAFQEVDYRQLFGGMAKWVIEIDQALRLPELLGAAWRRALSDRPGPVVVSLPEDMLYSETRAGHLEPVAVSGPAPSALALREALQRLEGAQEPLCLVGGSRWTAEASAKLQRFAERYALPVAVTFRRQGLFPVDHPHFAGTIGLGVNPALGCRLAKADCLLVLGSRLGEIVTQGYSVFDAAHTARSLLHVHPAEAEIGRVFPPAVAVVSTAEHFLDAALAQAGGAQRGDRRALIEADRAAYLGWAKLVPSDSERLSLSGMIAVLNCALDAEAIVTNGAGNYAQWLHRFYRFRAYNSQLAPTSGSMGYGLPAAIAAKIAFPSRQVVALAGDGCFSMSSQEFATAVQQRAAIIVVVADNGMFGTIRMHQERHYPGRISATTLMNPDFARLAEACGGHGERVTEQAEFAPAFERALASGRPSLLHCLVDADEILPGRRLSAPDQAPG